jgi:hypothetical protein
MLRLWKVNDWREMLVSCNHRTPTASKGGGGRPPGPTHTTPPRQSQNFSEFFEPKHNKHIIFYIILQYIIMYDTI